MIKKYAYIFLFLQLFSFVTFIQSENKVDGSIFIDNMGNHTIKYGAKFEYLPKINGDVNLCRKDLGHDDVIVHPQTGKVTWDTKHLAFGRGFYIRIKCSNYVSTAYASMVVHVDQSGKSKIVVAGKKGVSKYIGVAGVKMRSGDTLIIPDGLYPVSVDGDGSYENAFKMSAPPNGSDVQFTTVIAESPGGVTVSGIANKDIGKQKNAFQLSASKHVAIVGFVLKDVQRESFTTSGPGERLIVEFVGAQGAGTWGLACDNIKEAKKGQCSNAGMRVNGGTPLFQNSYDWGHNRYGIMTRSSSGSVTRRSLVRLDEHRGSQPYGGFSNYCDTAHLSQDNIVFDSLAIAAPHYKNYAGLDAYPATGCIKKNSEIRVSGLLAVNNKLSLSLLDSKAGPAHQWRNIVSYDSEGTCTPQKNRCGAWLLQSKKPLILKNSFLGKARGFKGSTSLKRALAKNTVSYDDSVIINDVPTLIDQGIKPTYLPESQLYFNGKSDTFFGDDHFDTLTDTRRWPLAGEDIIARNMRSYSNPKALKVGGGTVSIEGDRGAVLKNESMSEYFWSYIKEEIPPLVVRVNKITKDADNSYRIAWEHFSGQTRNNVKAWQVNCVTEQPRNLELIKRVPEKQLHFQYSGKCKNFAVQAVYSSGISGIAYIESSID
ncbi:MAG: hypothetical protein ACJAS9_001458 [Polaribacter sp.]|jgi:hypothetical protein